MHTPAPRHRRPSRGFTLIEALVTLGLMGLVTVGVLRFAIQALNIYHYDGGRLLVNKDIRTFTSSIAADAVASNYFRIYPDYQTRTAVTDGNSGDFLLLIFTAMNATTGASTIERLIGYYRDPANTSDPASLGPVRRFDVAIATADQSLDLATLLTQYAPTTSTHANPVVIQLAQGLANGDLFYNYYDRSVMIRGQIVEQGNQMRSAVNTYNFTVSPRG
jgi:hypothetical protein